jgi:hypothetical protein
MSRFAGLPAALKATKSATKGKPEDIEDPENPENEDEDDGTPPPAKSNGKETEVTEAEHQAAVETAKAEMRAATMKEGRDRMTAVMASEHYAGREAYAAKLLTKESLASASADDIIDLLADGPKVETTALTEEQQREAAEEGGRKEMKEALAGGKNSNVDPNGEGPGKGAETPKSKTAQILANQRAFGGGKRETK